MKSNGWFHIQIIIIRFSDNFSSSAAKFRTMSCDSPYFGEDPSFLGCCIPLKHCCWVPWFFASGGLVKFVVASCCCGQFFSVIVELKSAKSSTFYFLQGFGRVTKERDKWRCDKFHERVNRQLFWLEHFIQKYGKGGWIRCLFSFQKFGFATNSSSICLKEQRNISFEMTESWATFFLFRERERERKTMSSSSKERDRKVLFGWKISEKMATRQFELRSFRFAFS